MLFNDVMRPFPSGGVPLNSLLGQLTSFFGVFDCAEVQPVAVVCSSSDLLVCCFIFDDVTDVGYI
jgi:hypothetical protein